MSAAQEDPRGFLAQFPDGAILDEVQRVPDLPAYLQAVIDEDPQPGRWILSGSQNLALIDSISQSLAGRTDVLHLLPMCRSEVLQFDRHPETLDSAVLAGGFPRIFDRAIPPSEYARAYVSTYLERDVRQITNIGDLGTFHRFLELCAGRTGQLLKYASLASDCGVTQPTARRWVNVLEASFVVMRIPAWHSNSRKRIVKMPKLHFVDSGLACCLLGIRTESHLNSHPLRGALFESWVVAECAKMQANLGLSGMMSHYRDRDGVEADLIIQAGRSVRVIAAKVGQTVASDAVSKVRRVAAKIEADLCVDGVEPEVVHGGHDSRVHSGVAVRSWQDINMQAAR